MGELQGRVFGGYQLLDEIGGGGVGEVYRARPASGAGREVVVKVIFREFARQPGFARNFAYVTEAAARLASHPHILPLVAHGEEGDFLYLVTPYVQAGTLADLIAKGGRLGVGDVTPFFQQLCGALTYAHSLGVVHGNLKPSNVFLHEGRHVLLGDFGLLWDVRALDPSWAGSGVEAFEYLAPEVFAGQITQASDMYSLGATLFATLSGHPPFHASKLSELIAAAQQQPAPSLAQQQPPIAAALTKLDPVVAQAMAKRPDERIASAVLVAQGIEGALRQAAAQGMPGVAAPQGPTGPTPWQPLPSTPVSAGMFNAPPYPPGMAPGIAPGAALVMPPGIAPLSQLGQLSQFDIPFSPLPPAVVDEAMEQGGHALSGFHVIDPTMRIPAPEAIEPIEPTMRIPAPGYYAGVSGELYDEAANQPITAPRPTAARPGANGDLDDLAPLDPNTADLNESLRRISQRLPAVQRDPMSQSSQHMREFSPTELELPRLTNPALGNVPADWQKLLTDDSARQRHDPFTESNEEWPSLHDDEPFGASGDMMAFSGLHDGAWAAPSLNDSPSAQAEAIEAPRPRSRRADYNIEDLSARARSRTTGSQRADDDDMGDSLQAQRVWTNSHRIVNIGRSISRLPIVVLLLALIVLFELAGFAVARPDLCVTHACSVVAGQITKFAPDLRIPGAPAPIKLAPATLKISATTNGTGALQITMQNTAGHAVNWSATTTLGWLSVSPSTGDLAQGASVKLTLTAQPGGVAPGSYSAGLVIDAAAGQSATAVALTVTQGPVLSVATTSLAFGACGASQELNIANTGAAPLTYSATPSAANALSVSPGSGTLAPGAKTSLSVTLSCGATTGQQYAVILVSNGGSAQTPVTYGP